MNLLKNSLLAGLVRSTWFPLVLQVVMLNAFVAIIWGGWGVATADADFAKILRNTNLSNLLIWSYWWPLIIISAILLGRVWCTVCPMELASFMASKVGLRRRVPGFFKSGWVITIFYAGILLVGVHALAIHRQPHRMAIYMLMLLVAALVCGLLFSRRAFCSYVCPVGHLLGMYAMISPLQWRSADKEVCDACNTKDCIVKYRQQYLIGRSCTSDLYPATIRDNRQCLLCTQCAKVCPNENLALSVRWPFADLFNPVKFNSAQILFVMIVSGFVVYEVLSEWTKSKAILTRVPNYVNNVLDTPEPYSGLVSAVIMFVLFPALLYVGVWLLSKVLSRKSGKTIVGILSLALIPTMAAAHLIKACLKMISRIPYWRYVFEDPTGIVTAGKLQDEKIILDQTVANAMQPGLSWLMVAVLLVSLIATIVMLSRSGALKDVDKGGKTAVLLGVTLYWSVFAVSIIAWRF